MYISLTYLIKIIKDLKKQKMSNSVFSLQSQISLKEALISSQKSMQFATKETLSSQIQNFTTKISNRFDQSQVQELEFINHNIDDETNTKNQFKLSFFLGIDQNQQSLASAQYKIHENNTKFIHQLIFNPFSESIASDFDVQSYLERTIIHKKRYFFGKSHFQYLKSQQLIKNILKRTLTHLDVNSQLQIFQIIKKLNLIGHEESLQKAIALLQKTLLALSNTSKEVRKQCFLRLINLIHHKSLLYVVRMHQFLIVFAHTFDLDFDSMIFLTKIFRSRLAQKNKYNQLIQYMKHIIYILQKKMQREENLLYLPIPYQIASLLSFNKIQIPFYLPTGRPLMLPVESRETFKDIKSRLLQQFGVDKINPAFFRFIRVQKFQQEIQQFYISEDTLVWDQMSYIYLLSSEATKNEQKIVIFLVLKLSFPLENIKEDKQKTDILYANINFDYCLGKIEQISLEENIQICAILNYVNKTDINQRLYTTRLREEFSDQKILAQAIKNHEDTYHKLDIQAIKQKAISICSKSFNSHLKFTIAEHKIYNIQVNRHQIEFISHKGEIIKTIPIISIVSWNIKGSICELYLNPPHKNQIIISKCIHLLHSYLHNFSILLEANLIQ